MDINLLLKLFKTDLAIKNEVRDDYFKDVITASHTELLEKGMVLEQQNVADVMLIVDYAVWQYRHRMENIQLPPNLKLRIRNRIVSNRGA